MLRAIERIGPHNKDIISIFYGTLLGDSHIEKRCGNVRITFQQENKNCEYLYWLWKEISIANYCTLIKPKLKKRIGYKGKIRFYYKFSTYTYSSLNFLYNEYYYNNSSYKRVPLNINEKLTPLALACWIMDDGGRVGVGLKLATNAFIKEDIELLKNALLVNFNIISTLHKSGKLNQWIIYIPKSEIKNLQNIVKPYIVKSMLYKIQL